MSNAGFQQDEMHAFKTLRHFPELSHSLRSLHEHKETKGRGFKPVLAPIGREIQLKSTHGLESLCGSALGEVNALSNFRKTLLADRAIIKESLLAASITGTGNNTGKVLATLKVLSPLASAQEKLRIASVSFQGGGSTLNEFRGFKTLSKKDFLDQLRRSLKIQLMRDEQDALCEFLVSRSKNATTVTSSSSVKTNSENKKDHGRDSDPDIECVTFIRYFLKIGEEGKAEIRNREKALEESHRQQVLRDEQDFVDRNVGTGEGSSRCGSSSDMHHNHEHHGHHGHGHHGHGHHGHGHRGHGHHGHGHSLSLDDVTPPGGDGAGGEGGDGTHPHGDITSGGVSAQLTIDDVSEHSLVDVSSVLEKLSMTAVNWDNSSFIESVCTSGFESYLTPSEFRVQIAKSFGIKLTDAEVGALMQKYMIVKEDPPSQPHRPSTDLVDDGTFSIARSYNKPPPSSVRKQKHSGKYSGSGSSTKHPRNYGMFSPGGHDHHTGTLSGNLSSSYKHGGPSSVFSSAMYGNASIDDYCIDGHKFLKDFLSGSSIRRPAEAIQKQQRAVYQRRRDKVNQMGQNVDCLPKTLGR